MKIFRTTSRINEILSNINISELEVNNISNNVFNMNFNDLPIDYKNQIITKLYSYIKYGYNK